MPQTSHTQIPITDFRTVLTTTRAVRYRLDFERPVSRELVLDCIELALQAPTGADAEDWRFVLIGDAAVKRRVSDAYRTLFERFVRPRLATVSTDPRKARVYGGAAHLAENLHRAPWLVLACATRPNTNPKTAAAVYGSIFPAIWSFQLALRSQGLGSLITTLHLADAAGMAEILGIPEGVTQCALLPVAYTVGTDFVAAARKPARDVTYLDRWGAAAP